jgi:hypothetical protein
MFMFMLLWIFKNISGTYAMRQCHARHATSKRGVKLQMEQRHVDSIRPKDYFTLLNLNIDLRLTQFVSHENDQFYTWKQLAEGRAHSGAASAGFQVGLGRPS